MRGQVYLVNILIISSYLVANQSKKVKTLHKDSYNIQQQITTFITTSFFKKHQIQQTYLQHMLEAQRIWNQTPWYSKALSHNQQKNDAFLFQYLIPSMTQNTEKQNSLSFQSINNLTNHLCTEFLTKNNTFKFPESFYMSKLNSIKTLINYDQHDSKIESISSEHASCDNLAYSTSPKRKYLLILQTCKKLHSTPNTLCKFEKNRCKKQHKYFSKQIKNHKPSNSSYKISKIKNISKAYKYILRIAEQNKYKRNNIIILI